MTEKFNLMKMLREMIKEDKVKLEGATVVFRHPDGKGSATTIAKDLGVALRLIEESKIQEKMLEIQREEIAKKNIMPLFSDSKEEKRSSMFG